MVARLAEIKMKLNLEYFFALWISISLLGLTSVEAQISNSFIFFLTYMRHDNSWKEKNSPMF